MYPAKANTEGITKGPVLRRKSVILKNPYFGLIIIYFLEDIYSEIN
jgi:hypothetical protein